MLIEPESGRRPLLFDPNLTLGDPGFKLMGNQKTPISSAVSTVNLILGMQSFQPGICPSDPYLKVAETTDHNERKILSNLLRPSSIALYPVNIPWSRL